MDRKNALLQELNADQMEGAVGGKYTPGQYKTEAIAYLKTRMDPRQFERIMGHGQAQEQPYVAARICLSPSDWEEYVWIEQHGSLEGFH